MAPTKSDIWRFFLKNERTTTCKLCQREVKTGGNTTNLKNHIVRNHPSAISISNEKNMSRKRTADEADGTEVLINISDEENAPTASSSKICVRSSSPSPSVSSVASSTSTMFQSKLDLTIDSACKPINSLGSTSKGLKQSSIDESFQIMKSFKGNGEKATQITNSIVYMIVKDYMPFNTTERQGFKAFLKTVAPLYKPPGRKAITNAIDMKYDVLSSLLKKDISALSYISLSTDVWTETMTTTSYLGVTAHYVKNRGLKSIILGVYELTEGHTADYLGLCLKNICQEWEITPEKVSAIVTDNGANIVRAVTDAYGKGKHLPCFAHTLNLVATSSINLPPIKAVQTKISAIVTYFKQSISAADKLRKSQPENGKLKLIQQVPTRWNSTYFMVERFIKLSSYVAPILLMQPSSPNMLSAEEMQIATDMLRVLKPLENVSTELCGETYVTASKVIPLINCLKKEFNGITPTTPETKALLENTITEIRRRFGAAEKVKILSTATILDPRFKKIHFQDPLACSQAINNINAMLRQLVQEEKELKGKPQSPSPASKNYIDVGDSIWSHHESLVITQESENVNRESELNNVFKLYLQNPLAQLKTEPIKFWENYKEVSPNLAILAQQFLSIPGTSVPSERLFSQAGLTLSTLRTSMLGSRLSKCLFLHSLDDDDWH